MRWKRSKNWGRTRRNTAGSVGEIVWDGLAFSSSSWFVTTALLAGHRLNTTHAAPRPTTPNSPRPTGHNSIVAVTCFVPAVPRFFTSGPHVAAAYFALVVIVVAPFVGAPPLTFLSTNFSCPVNLGVLMFNRAALWPMIKYRENHPVRICCCLASSRSASASASAS